MTRWAAFELRTSCCKCEESLPINGPLRLVVCARCDAKNHIPDEELFEQFELFEEYHHELTPGRRSFATQVGGDHPWRFSYAALDPTCNECDRALRVETDGGSVVCECGARATVTPAPRWLRKLLPTAVICCGADVESAEDAGATLAASVEGEAGDVVVMSCPSCGAPLDVASETQRDLECAHCSAAVHIPEVLWRQLHPFPRMRRWFMSFEGESRLQKKQRREGERALEKAEQERQKAEEERGWGVLKILVGIFVAAVVATVVLGGYL